MSGWIKLHRKMTEWEWYDDSNTFRLFFHCLLMANHKPKSWRGLDIQRGSFWTSLDKLVEQTGLSKSVVRTCFKHLEMTGELTCKSHSTGKLRGRMVTVVKYNLYQGDDSDLAHRLTGEQHANDMQIAPTKNDKNEKNKDNDAPLSNFSQEIFDQWWAILPSGRKQAKNKCLPKWKRLTSKKPEDEIIRMAQGIANYLEHHAKENTPVNFIKQPIKMLNDEIWNDE